MLFEPGNLSCIEKPAITAPQNNLSPERFEFLFKTYYSVLTVFANKYIGDIETSRGIVQEMFIHLYERRDTLSIDQSPKAYLFQATRNRCLNYLKKMKKEQTGLEAVKQQRKENHLSYQDHLETAEFEAKVYRLINDLPPACQNVFRMSRFEGKKNAEIAEILNISKRTVETQISKALKIIRKGLAKSEDE